MCTDVCVHFTVIFFLTCFWWWWQHAHSSSVHPASSSVRCSHIQHFDYSCSHNQHFDYLCSHNQHFDYSCSHNQHFGCSCSHNQHFDCSCSPNQHFDYSATTMCYLSVSMPVALILTVLGILSWKGWHGVFNAGNTLSACCAHEDETGTQMSTQMLTWKNWKMVFHPVLTRTWTQDGYFSHCFTLFF